MAEEGDEHAYAALQIIVLVSQFVCMFKCPGS